MADPTESTGSGRSRSGGRGSYRQYLGSRRAKAHKAAHAESEHHEPAAIPDHPLIPADRPRWCDDPERWANLRNELAEAPALAFDTEFIGEASYRPQLCLIQLATAAQVLLIDPLATTDHEADELPPALRPVFERLTDAAHTVIVHAGEPDLGFIDRAIDRPPARLFDTQIAAGFCGFGYPRSLGDLVEEMLGVKLPKGMTFTQWDHRPLADTACRYAADDVRYLPALHAALRDQLEQRGRLAWAEEEFTQLTDPARYRFDAGATLRRIRAAGSLDPRGLAALEQLIVLREKIAERTNLPPRAVMRDKAMVEVARQRPTDQKQLRSLAQLPRPMRPWLGEIHDALRAAEQLDEADLPPTLGDPPPPEMRDRIDKYWKEVKPYCEQHELDPQLLTNRAGFTHFMHRLLRGDAVTHHPLQRGWRADFLAPLRERWEV